MRPGQRRGPAQCPPVSKRLCSAPAAAARYEVQIDKIIVCIGATTSDGFQADCKVFVDIGDQKYRRIEPQTNQTDANVATAAGLRLALDSPLALCCIETSGAAPC
jgi:hypothetical protein